MRGSSTCDKAISASKHTLGFWAFVLSIPLLSEYKEESERRPRELSLSLSPSFERFSGRAKFIFCGRELETGENSERERERERIVNTW